jgi:hypothetical protein
MDDLIRQLDMVMYASKDRGNNKYSTFSEVMQKAVIRKIELENEVCGSPSKEMSLVLLYNLR